ncbi:hypothetical protein BV898_05278 [Hypsibius exemplaris]|uniref:P-type domain-containing protein n=1 Tax=Hypsibius exemplaris TaxID=2072580 RepID=A0A1W0WZU0_HYPEX|nr:hypothetical protein BV898_05278 [Hypsibius exemplaris]
MERLSIRYVPCVVGEISEADCLLRGCCSSRKNEWSRCYRVNETLHTPPLTPPTIPDPAKCDAISTAEYVNCGEGCCFTKKGGWNRCFYSNQTRFTGSTTQSTTPTFGRSTLNPEQCQAVPTDKRRSCASGGVSRAYCELLGCCFIKKGGWNLCFQLPEGLVTTPSPLVTPSIDGDKNCTGKKCDCPDAGNLLILEGYCAQESDQISQSRRESVPASREMPCRPFQGILPGLCWPMPTRTSIAVRLESSIRIILRGNSFGNFNLTELLNAYPNLTVVDLRNNPYLQCTALESMDFIVLTDQRPYDIKEAAQPATSTDSITSLIPTVALSKKKSEAVVLRNKESDHNKNNNGQDDDDWNPLNVLYAVVGLAVIMLLAHTMYKRSKTTPQQQHQQFIGQPYQGQQQPIIQTMQPSQHQGQQVVQAQQQLQHLRFQQAPPPPPTEQATVAQQSIGSALAQHQPVYQAASLDHFPAHVSGFNYQQYGSAKYQPYLLTPSLRMPAVAFFPATNGSHLPSGVKEYRDLILGTGAVTVCNQKKFGRGGVRLAESGIEINKMGETFGDGKGPKGGFGVNLNTYDDLSNFCDTMISVRNLSRKHPDLNLRTTRSAQTRQCLKLDLENNVGYGTMQQLLPQYHVHPNFVAQHNHNNVVPYTAVQAMNPLPIIRDGVSIHQPSQLQQQPQFGQPVNASTDDQLAGNIRYGPTVQALVHSQPSTSAQLAETPRAFAEFQSDESVQFNVEVPRSGQIKQEPITPPKAPRKSLFQMNTAEADKYMSDIMNQVDGERLMNKKKKSPILIEEDSSSDEGEALIGNNRVRLATLGPKRKFPICTGAPKKVKRTNQVEVFCLSLDLTPDEIARGDRIRQDDFCSLYPSENLKGENGEGHVIIVTYGFKTTDLSQYKGIAQVTILPNRACYVPTLPYRTAKDENAKLMDYTSMRGIINGSGFASIQTHNPCSFKRSVNTMSVATVPQSRIVRCTVRGRVIGQDFITYPYGYQDLPFPVPGSPEHYLVNSIIAYDPQSENILRLERDFEKNSLQDYILERVS